MKQRTYPNGLKVGDEFNVRWRWFRELGIEVEVGSESSLNQLLEGHEFRRIELSEAVSEMVQSVHLIHGLLYLCRGEGQADESRVVLVVQFFQGLGLHLIQQRETELVCLIDLRRRFRELQLHLRHLMLHGLEGDSQFCRLLLPLVYQVPQLFVLLLLLRHMALGTANMTTC